MSQYPKGLSREDRQAIDGAEDPVLFYHQFDDWGHFSNFSSHAVTLPHPFTERNFVYLTSEHRYQAMKALDHDSHDVVAKAPDAGASKDAGRTVILRPDWGRTKNTICWYAMVEVLMAKALQHADVLDMLAETEGRHIYEDSPVDDIWGWRKGSRSYHGQNLLGEAWMHVRFLLLG